MKLKNISILVISMVISGILLSCSSMNKTQKGAIIGAGSGAAVGAAVGSVAKNTALGAIIGAAVGGATGAIIGKQMDKEAKEISSIPGAEVVRVGEGINVTFESGVLFAVDQATLNTEAQASIKSLADIFVKYPDSYILIEGHTDASGSSAHNMSLSERRAKSVAAFLESQNVSANRIKTAWYGENQPKVPNTTDTNKSQNRRVEFAIYANEDLINKAKKENTGAN